METDREILIWFHNRLVLKYGESELIDYMRRLRWIITKIPPNKVSRGVGVDKALDHLYQLKDHIKLSRKELLETTDNTDS